MPFETKSLQVNDSDRVEWSGGGSSNRGGAGIYTVGDSPGLGVICIKNTVGVDGGGVVWASKHRVAGTNKV